MREGGEVRVVDKGKEVVHEQSTSARLLREEMINYMSLGADAEIIFGFEKNRQASQFQNKFVYGVLGARQQFFRPRRLKKFISRVLAKENRESDGYAKEISPTMEARSLVLLNIPSIGGGANIWRTSNTRKQKGLKDQDVSDGLLEALTLSSARDVALTLGGMKGIAGIKRVSQESGYKLTLVPGTNAYLQVDGEGRKLIDAETITESRAFKVNLLMNEQDSSVIGNELPVLSSQTVQELALEREIETVNDILSGVGIRFVIAHFVDWKLMKSALQCIMNHLL